MVNQPVVNHGLRVFWCDRMVNQPVGNHGRESFVVVGFDLGPLLQGQTRTAKLKSAYNSLIIGPRG